MELARITAPFLLLYVTIRISRWFIRYLMPSPFADILGPPPLSRFMGNLKQLFDPKGLSFHEHLNEKYGGVAKVAGPFGEEQLYVSDPHALQAIVVKDQGSFEETEMFLKSNRAVFGPGLVACVGEQHRRQRKMVLSLFSPSQLQRLTPTFFAVAEKLARVMTKEVKQYQDEKARVVDVSQWMSRVALETIGQAILGYSFDPLESPHSNPYTTAVKELIPTLFTLIPIRLVAPFVLRLGAPAWLQRKLVEWTPIENVQKVLNMSDVMHAHAQDILRERRQALGIHGDATGQRSTGTSDANDLVTKLLQLNEEAIEGEYLTDDELTGQMTVMVFGGQDTTSSTLSRILHLLSLHPEVQKNMRDEIREAYEDDANRDSDHPDRLTFETIDALPWLDAVIKETLRVYPAAPYARRVCIKDTNIPYTPLASTQSSINSTSAEGASTPPLSSLFVPKGTTIFVSIMGGNRLESIWGADAKEWKPERWMKPASPPAKAKLPGVFSGMMTFFGGGRSCPGYRFALMEIKIVLVTLLSQMKFELAEDTEIVWNLAQILSPSYRQGTRTNEKGPGGDDHAGRIEERHGLPLHVTLDSILDSV